MLHLFIGLASLFGTTTPQTVIIPRNEPIKQASLVQIAYAEEIPAIPVKPDFSSTTTIKAYVMEQARLKGVDEKLVDRLIVCESDYFTQQSRFITKDGTREDSWGIWQINLPGKNITREQAMDIIWSTEWSLEQIKGGFKSWSCWPK